MARMRADALAALLERSDSHHCLSLMMKFRVAVQVQPGKSGHAGITSVLSSAMSRPMEGNPVTRLRRKELRPWRRLVKRRRQKDSGYVDSVRGRRQDLAASSDEVALYLRCLTSEARVPKTWVQLCAHSTVSARKKKSEIRTAVKLEVINACTPHP